MASATGRVLQVNVSPGGLPKLPVDQAWVSLLGLDGDGHNDRTVHGGPHRAVCLFGIEAIERLQAEGHPVGAGGVGENLTTTGIEWSLLPAGTRARIGDEVLLEISRYGQSVCDAAAELQRWPLQPDLDRNSPLRRAHVRPRDPGGTRSTQRPDRAVTDAARFARHRRAQAGCPRLGGG